MKTVRYYLKLLSIPLLILVLYISLSLVWVIFRLPSAIELTDIVKDWFAIYGLPVLFISSILESMLLIGSYFPGVFVIFISVILARSPGEAIFMVCVATCGLLIGHIFSYLLGRYGWYKLLVKLGMKSSVEQAQTKLLKKGPTAIFSSYWLPSLGALTDTAAGIIGMPFKTFITYAVISAIFWDSLVGIIVYILGDKALAGASPGQQGDIILYAIIIVWMLILVFIDIKEKRKITAIIN